MAPEGDLAKVQSIVGPSSRDKLDRAVFPAEVLAGTPIEAVAGEAMNTWPWEADVVTATLPAPQSNYADFLRPATYGAWERVLYDGINIENQDEQVARFVAAAETALVDIGEALSLPNRNRQDGHVSPPPIRYADYIDEAQVEREAEGMFTTETWTQYIDDPRLRSDDIDYFASLELEW
jgi:hypothetical protein